MKKTILLIGTFDTKGEEFSYIRDLIRSRGHDVILVDISLQNRPLLQADVSVMEELAAEAGNTAETFPVFRDRDEAIKAVTARLVSIVSQQYGRGLFHGVLSLGGGTGTNMATAAMRVLPLGVPKVMVSSVASGNISPYVDFKDITMMNSTVDIAGLNPFSKLILANAVGAICGMVEQPKPKPEVKPIVAASMFGVTTPCVSEVRRRLEQAGYDVVVFHANGHGGRAMEELIGQGFFAGVAEITATEWSDEVVGGDLSAGPTRLNAAAKKGIPQVVSCGALDIVNFRSAKAIPSEFDSRTFHHHHETAILMRTTPADNRKIGKKIAAKLNSAAGPVSLILPLKGISMLDKEGKPFYDPEADNVLFETLRASVKPPVKLVELDLHINDAEFAKHVADELLRLLKDNSSNK